MIRMGRRPSLLTFMVITLFCLISLYSIVLIRDTHGTKNASGHITERYVIQLKLDKPILTADCVSRLGNQMFSYATLFAISIYNEREAYMSPTMSSYMSKYFEVSLGTLSKFLYQKIGWETRMLGAKVTDDIRNLRAKKHGHGTRIKFCCFPQTWKYFDEIRPQILQEFQFQAEIRRKAQLELAIAQEIFYSHLPQENVTFIGIHVRRGDYVQEQELQHFDLPTVGFYKRAMEYFDRKYKNVVYILASDDLGWCRENFAVLLSQYKLYYIHGTTLEDGGFDMAVLSSCDHVIFGLGTFGFWAAYLNPGEVVYCSDCIKPNTTWMKMPMVYGGDYNNFALPRWIGMTWNGA